MIDVIKQTPREYSAQSRDYQVLARLYSALFNVSKMYIDNLSIWNNDIDNRLATLRAKTLNFDARFSWDEDDLEAVTSCFKYLMRIKGTKTVLEYCVNILMKIQGIVGEAIDEPIIINNYTITVRVPDNLLTLGVLEDLLSYVLPAGLIFNIVQYKSSSLSDLLRTEIVYEDGDITDEEEPYSEKMYVGPSDTVPIGRIDEQIIEVPISKDRDYWLYLQENGLIPENTDGINTAYAYDSEGNLITEFSKNTTSDREVSGVIIKPAKDVNIDTKKITDTFVYLKSDIKKEGKVIYNEKWEED